MQLELGLIRESFNYTIRTLVGFISFGQAVIHISRMQEA